MSNSNISPLPCSTLKPWIDDFVWDQLFLVLYERMLRALVYFICADDAWHTCPRGHREGANRAAQSLSIEFGWDYRLRYLLSGSIPRLRHPVPSMIRGHRRIKVSSLPWDPERIGRPRALLHTYAWNLFSGPTIVLQVTVTYVSKFNRQRRMSKRFRHVKEEV